MSSSCLPASFHPHSCHDAFVAIFLVTSDRASGFAQALASELLRLSMSVYKHVRDNSRNVLERALKRYTALAPAALPPVLLAITGMLSEASKLGAPHIHVLSARGSCCESVVQVTGFRAATL